MRIRGLFLFRRYTVQAFIVILLLSALILVSLRVKERKGVDLFDAILMEVSSPFQKAFSFVIKTVQGVFQGYLLLVNVQTENKVLRQRMAELQRENHEMKEIALANERFKKLLQFQEKISTSVTAAEVIGQDPSSWFKSITINKGEREGLQKGMAVISPEGVVGQILRVSPNYSVVLLLTDYNSAIDAVAQRTRAKAIVEGKGENRCQLKYLLRAEDVAVGDIAVTSGLGGNFPKGLVIGEIKQVDKKGHGIFQYAELVPSVDLTRLEEVLVITGAVRPPLEEKAKKVKGAKEGTKVPIRKSGNSRR
ncbi:MAG: rod shape-determining protein MreC [Deltaproteobacteria bacterium RBG_13_53_10]|nr:MAG: rod shape-determining protein MreC [Deltaproteobacteria bacterium RBG_13_53_10]